MLWRGELSRAKVRETPDYKEYRETFEGFGKGQHGFFKLLHPVGYVRIVQEELGREYVFNKAPAFEELTRGWHDMPLFPVKGLGGVHNVPIAEIWLDDPDKRVYERIIFDPSEKESTRYYNCFPAFIHKKADVAPMSEAEFAESAMG